jgi:hypothetical protein
VLRYGGLSAGVAFERKATGRQAASATQSQCHLVRDYFAVAAVFFFKSRDKRDLRRAAAFLWIRCLAAD